MNDVMSMVKFKPHDEVVRSSVVTFCSIMVVATVLNTVNIYKNIIQNA